MGVVLHFGLVELVSAVVGVFCHEWWTVIVNLFEKIAQIVVIVNDVSIRAGVAREIAISVVIVGEAAAGASVERLSFTCETTGGIVAAFPRTPFMTPFTHANKKKSNKKLNTHFQGLVPFTMAHWSPTSALTRRRRKRLPPLPLGTDAFTVSSAPWVEVICWVTVSVLQLPAASVSLHSI